MNWKYTPIAVVGLSLLTGFSYFGYVIVNDNLQQTRVMRKFQPVDARVTASAVTSHSINGRQHYDVNIQYRYRVAKHAYQSQRFAYISQGFKDYSEAAHLVEQYPAGQRFTAYYDPDSPTDAVIYRRAPALSATVMSIPFVLLGVFGLLVFIHGLRKSIEKPAAN